MLRHIRWITVPWSVLVIGSSTGYGLASRILAAYSSGSDTYGVFLERPDAVKRSASAGWYNNEAFENFARNDGLAAPVRTDPETGETYRSVIKPIGKPFSARTLDAVTGEIQDFHLEPATEDEVESTVKVMGGEDWQRWVDVLSMGGVLAEGTITVAYSYIGPSATSEIYRQGTIGKAKEHLERTAKTIDTTLQQSGGRAYVSINKALVTKASAVIPMVPLYISLLYKVMKSKGIHEDCIHQIVRLFSERLYSNGEVPVDKEGRIRLDDLEVRPDVQAQVKRLMNASDDTLKKNADFAGYWKAFLKFHGFGVEGVDYTADVEP